MNTPREQLQQAFQLQMAGKTREAGAAYRDILADYPDHPEATRLLGLVALQEKRAEDALPLLHKAAELAPANPLPWDHLCEAMLLLDRLEEAADCAEAAVTRAESNPQIVLRLASIQRLLGQNDEAQATAGRALELDPNHAAAQQLRGSLRFARGEIEPAIEDLLAARKAEDRPKDDLCLLAQALMVTDRLDELAELPPVTSPQEILGEIVLQAIYAWEHGAIETCAEAIGYIREVSRKQRKPSYFRKLALHLEALMAYHETRPESLDGVEEGQLILIGDSSVLAAANLLVPFGGKQARLASRFIPFGDLQQVTAPAPNLQRAWLERELDKLPQGVSVGFLFGRLRLRDMAAKLGQGEESAESLGMTELDLLAANYVSLAAQAARDRNLTPLFVTAPLPNIKHSVAGEPWNEVVKAAERFNDSLRSEAQLRDAHVIELYRVTLGADGGPNAGKFFGGNNDLRPLAIEESFQGRFGNLPH
ncbi:MAG: tetratricopeptide repeat protein [Rhodovibrionaceae bacterium]